MSETVPLLHAGEHSSHRKLVAECRLECLNRSVEAFERARLADAREIQRLRSRYLEERENGPPVDLIELLARIQGTEEEHMGAVVHRIAHEVSQVMDQAPPLIPFAGKLMAPSIFYESYTQLHELAREILSPVVFAEDTDAIGTGALNPVAAEIMGTQILDSVNRRFGIRPFITVVRLDYESWTFLCRKHFGL